MKKISRKKERTKQCNPTADQPKSLSEAFLALLTYTLSPHSHILLYYMNPAHLSRTTYPTSNIFSLQCRFAFVRNSREQTLCLRASVKILG